VTTAGVGKDDDDVFKRINYISRIAGPVLAYMDATDAAGHSVGGTDSYREEREVDQLIAQIMAP